MPGFGDYSKNEKKKKKKQGDTNQNVAFANKPVFVLPKKIEKKKKWE